MKLKGKEEESSDYNEGSKGVSVSGSILPTSASPGGAEQATWDLQVLVEEGEDQDLLGYHIHNCSHMESRDAYVLKPSLCLSAV